MKLSPLRPGVVRATAPGDTRASTPNSLPSDHKVFVEEQEQEQEQEQDEEIAKPDEEISKPDEEISKPDDQMIESAHSMIQ